MTGLHPTLRRLVVAVALAGAALAVAVLLLVLAAVGDPAPGGLPLVLALVVAAVLAAAIGLALLELLLRRHVRGLRHLEAQLDALGEGTPLPRTEVGLVEVDRPSARLAERAAEISRRQTQARDAAADASHQLRTPLTAMLLRLEEIAGTDDLDVVHEEATVAMGQVERLTGVVDTLLTRSKGGDVTVPEISLDSVLAGLQREYQPAFTGARRSMRVEGERGLIVRAAPSDLAQVLQTLVENALQHGAGTVMVEASGRGSSVVVEVRDEGPGIPAALAPHIFERSVTSHGSGLGLDLARQLAQRGGGRLELVQARPAVFTLFLQRPRAR